MALSDRGQIQNLDKKDYQEFITSAIIQIHFFELCF